MKKQSKFPVSDDLFLAIDALKKALKRDYGADYSFSIAGNGHVLAASNLTQGVIEPKLKENSTIGGLPESSINKERAFDEEIKRGTYGNEESVEDDTENIENRERFERADSAPDEYP